MTRKHFNAMAEYISATRASCKPTAPYKTAAQAKNDAFIRGMISLAVHMGREFNPRFDVERFKAACGGIDESAELDTGGI